jgi:ankyrin repeat protein
MNEELRHTSNCLARLHWQVTHAHALHRPNCSKFLKFMFNCTVTNASENGHAEVVQVLLSDARVDASADNNYAVRLASVMGHAGVVRVLLANPKVDPSAENNEALREASEHGHVQVSLVMTSS